MGGNMLRSKKTHRIRNFFLVVAALLLVIIVIGSLQQTKHSTAPSQSTASSQATTEPSPASATTPVPVTPAGSPEPSSVPATVTAPTHTPTATTETSPEPSPVPAPTTQYEVSIAPLVLNGSKVKVNITTNVPGEIEVVADLTLAGQASDDVAIDTRAKYVLIHNGKGQTTLDGSTLPTGKYEVKVNLYPWWGLKDDVSKSCGLKQDLGYSIGATAVVTLTGTGESAEAVEKRKQGQRWVESNVFGGTKWDPSSWVAKFGSWEELEVSSGNPQILKMFYFKSIDMSLMVNVLKGEIVTWQLGKAGLQAATQPPPTPATTPTPTATTETSPEPGPAPANTRTGTNDRGGSIGKKVEAWAATTMLIKDRLKAPRTARFNGGAWNVVYLGNNRYRVKGSVDSQNSFGAMIRTTFQAIVRDEGDEHQTWILEDLQTSP